MYSTRQNKVSRLLQKELGDIFQKDAHGLDKKALITVTVVRISPDLGDAKVYLSLFNVDDKALLMDRINELNYDFRRKLGSRIKMQVRRIPTLSFYLDDSLDYAERIDKLLSGDEEE